MLPFIHRILGTSLLRIRCDLAPFSVWRLGAVNWSLLTHLSSTAVSCSLTFCTQGLKDGGRSDSACPAAAHLAHQCERLQEGRTHRYGGVQV
jgi:hypothetical protein